MQVESDSTSAAIKALLEEVFQRCRPLQSGAVADYIPELAKADPEQFGIAIATATGRIYTLGDTDTAFTIQSISKPFAYGLALQLLGEAALQRKVGVEPSGEAFNAISLDAASGIPRNPMINAGAIATAAQIQRHLGAAAEDKLLQFFSSLAGRTLTIDTSVYQSEAETGHRNRAISHLLRNFEVIEETPEAGLDLYFRQCSINVTCQDLALMAATLACQGRHPRTQEQVLTREQVVPMLALMGTCGMYDYAGQWLYDVGMPAKSGVAGGVLAVIPGRLGLAVYSPRLDAYGNSVRGIAVCQELSRRFALHLFDQDPASRPTIRRIACGVDLQSRLWRCPAEERQLQERRAALRLVQAQGVLDLAAMEELLATLRQQATAGLVLVVDLAYVTAMAQTCAALLVDELATLGAAGKPVLLSRAGHLPALVLREGMPAARDSLDQALEAAETWLLEAERLNTEPLSAEPLSAEMVQAEGADVPTQCSQAAAVQPEPQILPRLTPAQRAVLEPLLERRRYAPGDAVLRLGDPGNALFLVESGLFRASLPPASHRSDQQPARLATFSPGTSFGEISLLTGKPCTADVTAETPGSCLVLPRAALERLRLEQPATAIALLEVLFADLGEKLARTSQQLTLLEQS